MRNPVFFAFVAALLALPPGTSGAAGAAAQLNALASRTASGDGFLDPDVAFRLAVTPERAQRVQLRWTIAPGYYLYRDRIKLKSTTPGVTLGQIAFPAGITKTDEFFGEQVIYHDELLAHVMVTRAAGASQSVSLAVTYQGCAEAGLCYPPTTKTFEVGLPGDSGAAGSTTGSGAGVAANTAGTSYVSEQDSLAGLIVHGHLLAMLAVFFAAGLALAFTPCVLPMVPILSQIIAGHGTRVTARRGFALSLAYVLGMAVTYTAAGAAAAAAGQQVQAAFQQPWVVTLFAALFVTMALSMFGLFTVQMPAAIQSRLSVTSGRLRAGSFGGVALMGVLSALIVTTCVGPALVAALVVIGQTGNVTRGAAALFAMSLGMGAPLLVVGASAGALLPRAGAWMEGIKRLFGVMMLAMAAWMLARVLPGRAVLLAFAVPAMIGAWVLWRFTARRSTGQWIARGAGVAAGLYGVLLLFGCATGGTDPFKPWMSGAAQSQALSFRTIRTVGDLDRELQTAAARGRAVMLDFYADWCISCKEMERYTFTDPKVQQSLATTVLLRADVTANSSADQTLLRRFGIYGPPTIAFYGPDGRERPEYRVVGYMKAPEFAAVLRQAGVGRAAGT